MPMGTARGPSLSEDEGETKEKVRVSGNVNENENERARGAPAVVDTGLLSLLGSSRTRCGSGSVPPAVLDVP
jgi:hypothetical protein